MNAIKNVLAYLSRDAGRYGKTGSRVGCSQSRTSCNFTFLVELVGKKGAEFNKKSSGRSRVIFAYTPAQPHQCATGYIFQFVSALHA